MTTSFAAYASQFLNRQQNVPASRMSDSQPMFFSFTTDDGSRAGYNDTDLDDFDDPHFGGSQSRQHHSVVEEEDDDPYLRLDEDENTGRAGSDSKNHQPQSIPLISPEGGELSDRSDSPRGWLAHQASPMRMSRSPSPSPSTSSDSDPPPDLLAPGGPRHNVAPPPSTDRGPVPLSLTESLLPRDGYSRPLDVFSLPDPRHTTRGRRKYNDFHWTALWCAGVSFCVLFSIVLLFITRMPSDSKRVTLPYTTLLHTVPMLTILTFVSAFVAYTHILLLRIFVRPVMIVTSVFIPATLFISAIWAFVGSFMWDGDKEPTWGETVGLRLFSLVPLVLSLLTARRLVHLPRNIHTTSSTLTLTTHLLLNNPFLLALSPTILLASLISSIPFLTLIFRLLLMGTKAHPYKGSPAWEWHVYSWANWAIFATVTVWLWTWGVARGVLRTTCAGVIGAWYFANPDAPIPPPTSTHTIHAALTRSTGPSLGTIALSALILTAIRLLTLLTLLLHRLPLYIPARAFFLVTGIRMAVGALENVTTALSEYALIYTGLTGDPFMASARRARALTTGAEAKIGRAMKRRRGGSESPLTLLTVAPLTLTFPFALMTYLFVAHTLDAPGQALGASVLAGGVTALVGLFCVGLVQDTADTLWICYCIDKETGHRRKEEVFVTFEYGTQPQGTNRLPQSNQTGAPQQPTRNHPPPSANNPNMKHPVTTGLKPQPSRLPSNPQRQPEPQVGPSASTSHTQRLPLPPPPSAEDDELDPFEQSYLEDNSHPLRGSGRSPPTLPAILLAASDSRAKTHSPTHSLTQSNVQSQSTRMMTSRELNMKSTVLAKPGSASPKPTRHNKDSVLDSESEDEGQEGSQFFPGSGLFGSQ